MGSTVIRPIDVCQLGHERVVCVFLIGDVLVDCGPASRVHTLLEALGDARPRVIALTHIHLDHAGAVGTLVERWPDVEVWVHERGAPHLVDPAKLLASATRLYGDDMDRLWGEVRAVPEANLRVLRGGERLPPPAPPPLRPLRPPPPSLRLTSSPRAFGAGVLAFLLIPPCRIFH